MRAAWSRAGLLLCAGAGCFNPEGSASAGGGGTTGSTSGSPTGSTTGGPETTTGSTTRPTTGTTSTTSTTTTTVTVTTVEATLDLTSGAIDACGDGLVLGGEECDDGNVVPGDGCTESCTRERWVFVTATAFGVKELEGIDGANKRCNEAAGAAAMDDPRLKGRTFAAWIGDDDTSAKTQLGGATGPYYLLTQPPMRVAESPEKLLSGTLEAAINVTETGTALEPGVDCNMGIGLVWTGSESNGVSVPGNNCAQWMSADPGEKAAGGRLQAKTGEWSNACSVTCEKSLRVYCFEL